MSNTPTVKCPKCGSHQAEHLGVMNSGNDWWVCPFCSRNWSTPPNNRARIAKTPDKVLCESSEKDKG